MTRSFNAPIELVFDSWTTCESFASWYGPEGWTVPECEIDLRPGGLWRVVMRNPDGSMEMASGGEYREVDRANLAVYTEAPEGPMLDMIGSTVVTLELENRDGRTFMTRTTLFESPEKRDTMLHSGANEGWQQSFRRLDEQLALGA